MAKCIRCGKEAYPRKICLGCLQKWSDMRTMAHEYLTGKFGPMTALNHEDFKKGIKKLEKIWRKSPDKFEEEITIVKAVGG